jgi:cardiolipin synthase
MGRIGAGRHTAGVVAARPDERFVPMLTVPNILTLLRLALVPVVGYLLAVESYGWALGLFLVAALTDFVDGYIARRFGLVSKLGATLDPVADKLNMLVVTVLLAWQLLIPIWLALAIVVRDVVIAGGAVAYHVLIGPVKMAPTLLSKINTFIEFALLLLVMAAAARRIESAAWLTHLFPVVLATVVASGVQYVWLWGRKAVRDGRRR